MRLTISKRSAIKWTAIIGVAALALWLYNNDSEAPKIEAISFSSESFELSGESAELEFSGRITDERGIKTAQLHCIEDSEVAALIHIAISGVNRHLVSFGLDGTSYNWSGNWDGNRYDLSFEARGKIPANAAPISCDWYSLLTDELGNESWQPLGYSLEVFP